MEFFLTFLIGSFISGIVFAHVAPKKLYWGAAIAVLIVTFIYFNFNSYI
ncbi:MAG: hypothetical protein ACI9EW_001184 [Cellvibrionaceae bacterium]|jgi:hypothetical protein